MGTKKEKRIWKTEAEFREELRKARVKKEMREEKVERRIQEWRNKQDKKGYREKKPPQPKAAPKPKIEIRRKDGNTDEIRTYVAPAKSLFREHALALAMLALIDQPTNIEEWKMLLKTQAGLLLSQVKK